MLSENKSRFSGKRKLQIFTVLLIIAGFTAARAQGLNQDSRFILGAFIEHDPVPYNQVLNTYNSSGMDAVIWHADASTDTFLTHYNVVALNSDSTDWIFNYSTGYYSKWPSSRNQTNQWKLGVKHSCGDTATWHDTLSWSSSGVSVSRDSLVYGPHYFQEKKYRRTYQPKIPQYTVRFRMAFHRGLPQNYNLTDPVCRIKVVYSYKQTVAGVDTLIDTLFQEKTLTVGDFPEGGYFKYFDFGDVYQYPSKFPTTPLARDAPNVPPEGDTMYTDWVGGTGIQFCVDWLGNSSLGTLYVDFAEVYDANTWEQYINPQTHNTVINRINDYVTSHNWPNIKYWYVHDEPHTIDAFAPMHIVDSLVHVAGGAPLITKFWMVGTVHNGDSIYNQYYRMVRPKKLMFDGYPFCSIMQ